MTSSTPAEQERVLAETFTMGYGTMCFGIPPRLSTSSSTDATQPDRDFTSSDGKVIFNGPQRVYRIYNQQRPLNPSVVEQLASQPLSRYDPEGAIIVGVRGNAMDVDSLTTSGEWGTYIPPVEYNEASNHGVIEIINGHHRIEALRTKSRNDLQRVEEELEEAQLWEDVRGKNDDLAVCVRQDATDALNKYIDKTRWLVKAIDVGEYVHTFQTTYQPMFFASQTGS
jgi:hypothetical protein